MSGADWADARRRGGLWRFAIAISTLNILGHSVLGFEQAWATPFVALAAAYAAELLPEWIDARLSHRAPRFAGGLRPLAEFLLSPHITGLAVGMLIYSGERMWPVAFAAAAGVASKTLFRVSAGMGSRHFFNPSNFGISLTLLVFPWVAAVPPYHFTENLTGVGYWILPGIIVCTGTFLNARFTKRLPLIAAWLSGFVLQAFLRHWFLDARLASALLPMTGVAFVLYTFYMVTDPATTPSSPRAQLIFGASVAFAYGLLVISHVVFGLFFALSIVCTVRGVMLWAQSRQAAVQRPAEPTAVAVGASQ